jgi:hypothetical protein
MLNREKLATDLHLIISKLFPDITESCDIAQKKWKEIVNDPAFAQKVEAAQSSFLLPRWRGNLSDTFEVPRADEDYIVVAVDGSQVYPDRHIAGAGCFLVNVGGVVLSYSDKSSANFFCFPKVFVPEDIVCDFNTTSFSRDLVDLKREELELKTSLEQSLLYKEKNVTCLFDGTIIFWNLEAKPPEVKKHFLKRYLYYLDQFYQNKIVCGGYISMPKSKELVNLIKIGLCRFTAADCIGCHREYDTFPCQQVDSLIDTHIARTVLRPVRRNPSTGSGRTGDFFERVREHNNKNGENFISPVRPELVEGFLRTTIFYSTSKIINEYPDHLKPAFFYLDIGKEIIRIEVPRWVAEDEKYVNQIASVAIDQSEKGLGYPVCLAEAHEQAVVKGPDREFFYHVIQKVGMDKNKNLFMSQKSVKKRGLGV